MKLRCLALGAVLLAGARVEAQQYFGQNQVQYKHFNWRVIETEHFLVHYYPEEKAGAMDAARMAERSYSRLSRLLDHQFRRRSRSSSSTRGPPSARIMSLAILAKAPVV